MATLSIPFHAAACLLVSVAACLPGASVDKEQLVKTASFDHSCPPEKVQVITEDDQGMSGTGRYLLDVCGTQRKYKRAGTMYYDADKGLVVDGKKVME
jgi:hypothetical protein